MCVQKFACPALLLRWPTDFNISWSTEHARIQYKEMLYLVLYRLIIQAGEKLQEAMATFNQTTCTFLLGTFKLFMEWKT